jgi:hypothetical protein
MPAIIENMPDVFVAYSGGASKQEIVLNTIDRAKRIALESDRPANRTRAIRILIDLGLPAIESLIAVSESGKTEDDRLLAMEGLSRLIRALPEEEGEATPPEGR